MDNEEAKFILRAYRPNGADAADPMFSGALEQARQDPGLAKWFEQEQSLDRVLSKRLQEVAAPLGLREGILAGGRVSAAPRNDWRQMQWLAVAASLMVALGLAMVWTVSRRHAVIDRMESFAINDVAHQKHDNEGEANARLLAVLENVSVHLSSGEMPANLAELKNTGCRTLHFSGHDIAEICFTRSGKTYHLYVMSKIGEVPATPRLLERSEGAAAAWSDEKNSYVVATQAKLSDLEAIL